MKKPRLLLLALTAVACGPSVTLTTDRATYRPGEDVTLTLENGSLAAIEPDLCSTQLIAPDGGASDWGFMDAGPGAIAVCVGVGTLLRTGERATAVRRLNGSLEPGEYHYRARISFDGRSANLASNAFEVAP